MLLCIISHTELADAEKATHYYALLIGQSYGSSEAVPSMPGSLKDAEGMKNLLESMNGTPYSICMKTDLSAEEIINSVKEVFQNAKPGDVCLLYYSGHGLSGEDAESQGALAGADGKRVTLKKLYEILKHVQGQRILILDSCYSGSIVSFLAAGEAEKGREETICALCSAGPFSQAMEASDGKTDYGAFTRSLILGSDPEKQPADLDRDGYITLTEAYYYAKRQAYDLRHVPVVYPEGSQVILWGGE